MPILLGTRRSLIGGSGLLPFTDDFNRANGVIGNGWTADATWAITTGTLMNTPNLGSELYANTGFASDTSWTKGTGWTIASGVATHASGSTSSITQVVGTVGVWGRMVYTVSNYGGSNGVSAQFGGSNDTASGGQSSNGTATRSYRSITTTAGFRANSAMTGDLDNVSFKAYTLSELLATREFGRNDVDITAKLAGINTGNAAGIVLNLDSYSNPQNFVLAIYDRVNAFLIKCVGGTYTDVINTAATFASGASVRVTKRGTTYQLFYNGSQVGTDQTISDVGIISNTRHGIFNLYELNAIDDFSIVAN